MICTRFSIYREPRTKHDALFIIRYNRDFIIERTGKKGVHKNMNMTKCAFFSEVGTEMILELIPYNTLIDQIQSRLEMIESWENYEFPEAARLFKDYDYKSDSRTGNLVELRDLLLEKRHYLIGILGNPKLLEHDSFTEMLWAVFHIADELAARNRFTNLPDSDLNHLSIDIQRAFTALIVEWTIYIAHLKTNYPYLYSMALRKNPFCDRFDVIIR